MKRILLLGACLVALASSPIIAQTAGEAEVVIVQFYHQGTPRSYVAIARGGVKPEVLDMKGDGVEEAQFCQQIIAKLYQEGYTIKSTFGGSSINTGTLVFIREK